MMRKSQKIFSANKPKKASVLARKLGNKSVWIQKPPKKHLRVRIAFTVKPAKLRAEYIELLDKMIKRVEKIINGKRTKTRQRLRAMEVLADLIKVSYGMIRDVEIEELEREVKALESEEEETA